MATTDSLHTHLADELVDLLSAEEQLLGPADAGPFGDVQAATCRLSETPEGNPIACFAIEAGSACTRRKAGIENLQGHAGVARRGELGDGQRRLRERSATWS